MSLNFPVIWCDVIPVIRIQMMPFWPDAETSKEQSPADVKKDHFSIFMIRLVAMFEADWEVRPEHLGSPEGDGM